MRLLGLEITRGRRAEARAGSVTSSASPEEFYQALGLQNLFSTASGVVVTTETALSVPAIWGAVNFLAGTIAGLPLNLYRRLEGGGREKVESPLATILHDAANEELTSFSWRKQTFDQVFTGGRGLTFIERNRRGEVINLWALDPTKVTVKRDARGRKFYEYKPGGEQKAVIYKASEIIDIPFMLKADGLGHRGPIHTIRDVIALAIAATQFGSKFFQNGGVPPFAVTGNFVTGAAMDRAAVDLAEAVRRAAKEQRQSLVLPAGLDIKALGADAQKSQLVELKKFLIEEVARIYSLPPTFVQDLSNGTHSNTEQMDLHFVKHTLGRWVIDFEQELNLKLFGREDRTQYVELNVDGLLRGDFRTRMEGYAKGIQNAVLTPNEARRLENRPDDPKGNDLLIQGATVPLGQQPVAPAPSEPPVDDPGTTSEGEADDA